MAYPCLCHRIIIFCILLCQDCDARRSHWQWSADCHCRHQAVPFHEVAGSGPERHRHSGSAPRRKSLQLQGHRRHPDALHQGDAGGSGIKCEIKQQRFVWSSVQFIVLIVICEMNWVLDPCYRCCCQQHASRKDSLNDRSIIWPLSTSSVPSWASARNKQRPTGLQTNSQTLSSTS